MPKSLLKRFSLVGVAKQAGFTMIELLVVISVIGVLAVAVLASINPIEQINKGRDTRTRSDAAQLINAIDRYVAIHEEYPWNTSGTTAAIGTFNEVYEMTEDNWDQAEADWADLLVTTSEVKDGFIARQQEEESLFVFKPDGYDSNTYVCFTPTSNAFRQEAADDCFDTPDGKTRTLIDSHGANIILCETDDGSISPSGGPQNYICLP